MVENITSILSFDPTPPANLAKVKTHGLLVRVECKNKTVLRPISKEKSCFSKEALYTCR